MKKHIFSTIQWTDFYKTDQKYFRSLKSGNYTLTLLKSGFFRNLAKIKKEIFQKKIFQSFPKNSEGVFELSSRSWVQKRPLFHFPVCGFFLRSKNFFKKSERDYNIKCYNTRHIYLQLLKSGFFRNLTKVKKEIFQKNIFQIFPKYSEGVSELSWPSWVQKRPFIQNLK